MTTIINRNFNNSILLTISIISLLFWTSCLNGNQASKPIAKSPQKADPVLKTESIKLAAATINVTTSGNLLPYEEVEIHAKVSGFIKQILVDRGSRVRKGQLLAILEAPEINQEYAAGKSDEAKVLSNYQFTKQNYSRLLEAAKTQGAVAPIELEQAKSAMEGAKAAYRASKATTGQMGQMKDYLQIRAPFNGIITRRNFSVGALVGDSGNTPLFQIAEDEQLRLTVAVPEKYASWIEDKVTATFTVTNQPGKEFTASLSRNSGLINSRDHSLTLEFDFDNTKRELNGGEYARVKLSLKKKSPTFWINPNAILSTSNGDFVFTLQNKRLSKISVTTGVEKEGEIEVFGTLHEQDSVILNPKANWKDGIVNQ